MIFPAMIAGLMAVFPAGFALADVTVHLDENTRVIAVDGRQVSLDTAKGADGVLRLENGAHQLLLERTAEIEDSADETLLETSDTHVLRFEAADSRLSLDAPEIDSRHEMQAFNGARQWRLVDDEAQDIAYVSDVLEKHGLQFGRDYEAELARFNRSTSAAAIPRLAEAGFAFDEPVAMPMAANGIDPTSAVASPSTLRATKMSDQALVGKMLKFWYQQASSITRNDFKHWLEESR